MNEIMPVETPLFVAIALVFTIVCFIIVWSGVGRKMEQSEKNG